MLYRKYKYMRLDGSSKVEDRRDMVEDFQNHPDIFVFLLSTRAGGLGINLTAADTVIFYDSDWNPTMDEQAMDRCHRLGQEKQVTVYRLVTMGTVEEKILKRAREKHTIQSIVITGGKFQGDQLRPKEVVSLLLDDGEVEENVKSQIDQRKKLGRGRKSWVTDDGEFKTSAADLLGAPKKKKTKSPGKSKKGASKQEGGVTVAENVEDSAMMPPPPAKKRKTKASQNPVNTSPVPSDNANPTPPKRKYVRKKPLASATTTTTTTNPNHNVNPTSPLNIVVPTSQGTPGKRTKNVSIKLPLSTPK